MFEKLLSPRRWTMGITLCLFASGLQLAHATEDRAPMPGSPNMAIKHPLASAKPAADATLHINFMLKSANRSQIAAFRASQDDPKSANYHKPLSNADFGKKFGATDADVKAVADFATAHGFKITHQWESKLFIAADVSVADAEKAFQVSIQTYARPAQLLSDGESTSYFGPDRTVTLPKSIADRVDAVFGLDNLLQMHPRVSRKQATAVTPPSPISAKTPPGMKASFSSPMSPADISHFYGLDNFHSGGVNGDGQNIGIISPTSYNFQDNIDFANNYGLSGWTVHWVNFDGGPQNFAGATEACLDTEVMIGQAPHSSIWVFQFPNNLNYFIDAYNLISNSYNFIQVVSQSWGLDEATMHAYGLDSTVTAYNVALSNMGAHGISFYNSSGDAGGVPIVPSTDPNATAVGGTDNLVNNGDGTWNSEQGWNGSGGGNSRYFSTPSWQSGPGVSNGYSNGHRQVPDVSAAGGPTPGYSIRTNGGWYQVWGTSASCPLWATANLLLDQETNNLYGLTQWHSYSLNPELYWMGTNLNAYRNTLNGAFVYRDATTGSTTFPTTDAWDYVTGWGSANFWKLWTDYVEYWGAPGYAPYDGRNGFINITGGSAPGNYDDQTTYTISAPVGCSGAADMPNSTLDVQVDGVDHYYPLGSLPVGFFWPNGLLISTTFTPGNHTINQILTVATPNYTEVTTLSSVTITVNPAITGFILSANPVTGGTWVLGTINFSSPTPAGGAVVSLGSTNSDVPVPANISVLAGYTSWNFWIQTLVSPTTQTGTITASYNSTSAGASLTVNPLLPTTLVVSPSSVIGTVATTGTVTLNGPAPSGGAVVTLANTNPAASVPATFTIAGGATSGSFTINTSLVSFTKTGVVKATYNGVTLTSATLSVKALQPSSITLSPTSIAGGNNVTGKVTLNAPAPGAGVTVSLASNSASAVVPATVLVPGGATFQTFTITTTPVTVATIAKISGTFNAKTVSSNLTVKGPAPKTVTLSPSSVYAGTSSLATLTMTGPAPAGGVTVPITSSNVAAAVPASVFLAAGATTITFTVTTSDVALSTSCSITATYNAVAVHGTLTVKPNSVSKLTISPTSVKGGVTASGVVTLTSKAATNVTVTFASTGGTTIPAPASVTILAGHTTSASFPIHTTATAVNVTATITATAYSTSKTASLTATP